MPAFTQTDLDVLRLELSLKAKNGLNFIAAATLLWLLIAFIWTLPYSPTTRSLFTFYASGLLLPLAWVFSRLMGTQWNIPGNPLQPLGLWLNAAQLAYFPLLIFVYVRYPQHFIMVYAIITGAHFLPYGWFYNTKAYVVMAMFISVGALWLGLVLPVTQLYMIPLLVAAGLFALAVWITADYRSKRRLASAAPVNTPLS